MWFAIGTQTPASKSNQRAEIPLGSAFCRHGYSLQRLLSKSPIRYVYCYLLPNLGPDYLNTHKNVSITWLRSVHTSGHDRPVPGRHAAELRRRNGASQELSLVRSSVLRRKPQARARQINNPHQASPQVTQTSEGRRSGGGLGDLLGTRYSLGCSLSRRGRHADSSCLSFKHDLLLRRGSCALVRHILLSHMPVTEKHEGLGLAVKSVFLL